MTTTTTTTTAQVCGELDRLLVGMKRMHLQDHSRVDKAYFQELRRVRSHTEKRPKRRQNNNNNRSVFTSLHENELKTYAEHYLSLDESQAARFPDRLKLIDFQIHALEESMNLAFQENRPVYVYAIAKHVLIILQYFQTRLCDPNIDNGLTEQQQNDLLHLADYFNEHFISCLNTTTN